VTSHEVGAGALSLLQGAQPPLESVVATLVNDLDAVCDDVVLVLDDFHVVEGREVHEGLAFLLEHLPPRGARGDRHACRSSATAGAAAGTG
jgi:LuxR family transcriptional regulator, maltose regulon positive regulatory protein